MKSNGDIDIESWSKERFVDNGAGVDINIGNVGKEQSLDLLYMQWSSTRRLLIKSSNRSIWKVTLMYKIGFNMSTNGIVQSGWSDYFTIPSDFNIEERGWSILDSIPASLNIAERIWGSIMDADGNGKPDLVIYVVERATWHKPLGTTYFRIGKDLNSEGIVEGGWTDHKMTPGMADYGVSLGRSMDIGNELVDGHSTLISAKRVYHYHTDNSQKIVVTLNPKDIFKEVMKTAHKYSAIESVTENCELCYNDNLKGKTECQQKLNLCKAKIDELRIFQDLPRESLYANRRMSMNYAHFGYSDTYVSESKNSSFGYFTNATSRDDFTARSISIYCSGFQYFLDYEDVCDTIDAKSVYSKGLEITFTKFLNDSISKKEDINSTSIFEDTLGPNGGGEPIIVQAEIRGRKKPTKQMIKNALNKARKLKQLPSMKDLYNVGPLFKTTKYWNKKQSVWIVNFHFKASVEEFF